MHFYHLLCNIPFQPVSYLNSHTLHLNFFFSWPWKVLSCHAYTYPECCWMQLPECCEDNLSRLLLFYTDPFFFFALHSSIVKPCSVTSNKNYTPSLPKPLWPVPYFLIRTHLLLWDWSCFQQDPASEEAYTSHPFCTPTCTSLLPTKLLSHRGSFCKYLPSNIVIILLKLRKSYFWPSVCLGFLFFLFFANGYALLCWDSSYHPYQDCFLPPLASWSACSPVSHTLTANSLQ